MKMNKIQIKISKNADTRSAEGNVTKEDLWNNTQSHINDVINVGNFLADYFKGQLGNHDYTKEKYIDMFYEDFKSGRQGAAFKELPWYSIHLMERHHLNDRVPDDVNLLDVLEMVVDCTVAGLARSGEVWPITIPNDVLRKAIDNTKQLIIDNVEVIK